ncbi:MAG: hypothetical protein WC284_12220 [Candidimonas sp.]
MAMKLKFNVDGLAALASTGNSKAGGLELVCHGKVTMVRAKSIKSGIAIRNSVAVVDGDVLPDIVAGTHQLVPFSPRKEWSNRARWARKYAATETFLRLVPVDKVGENDPFVIVESDEADVSETVSNEVSDQTTDVADVVETVAEVVETVETKKVETVAETTDEDVNVPTMTLMFNKAASVAEGIAGVEHMNVVITYDGIKLVATNDTNAPKMGDKKSDGTNRRLRAKVDLTEGKYVLGDNMIMRMATEDDDLKSCMVVTVSAK